jgi:hypothetical protein
MIGILAERQFRQQPDRNSFAEEILPNWPLDEAVPVAVD